MKLPTFMGGAHPPAHKELTSECPIEAYVPQGLMVFPMSQHIGAPCSPTVKKGDRVLVGQKIGDTEAFVAAPILSSVSGTVVEVGLRQTIPGSLDTCVVVENDGLHERDTSLTPHPDYEKLEPKEILRIIRDAGIVGLGGACFPTAVKLSPPPDRNIRWLIVNGAECEPYLNCDNRLMREGPADIVRGLRICKQLFPNAEGVIAIEDNKPEAFAEMTAAIAPYADEKIRVSAMEVKYPQGAEKMLIYTVTGQEIPVGALPADVGCIILNVRTIHAIEQAIVEGLPLTDRIISVTGDAITTPKNLLAPLGTSIRELVDFAGGFKEQPAKVLAGGPMMGTSMRSLDVPVVKGTSGILALTAKSTLYEAESSCLRCGRCVDACPMGLQPATLDHMVRKREYALFEETGGMNCIECGSCTYMCPSRRFLTQTCREGKAAVLAERRKKGAK